MTPQKEEFKKERRRARESIYGSFLLLSKGHMKIFIFTEDIAAHPGLDRFQDLKERACEKKLSTKKIDTCNKTKPERENTAHPLFSPDTWGILRQGEHFESV